MLKTEKMTGTTKSQRTTKLQRTSYALTLIVILILSITLIGCGKKETISVEDQVAQALLGPDDAPEEDINGASDSDIDATSEGDIDDVQAGDKSSEDSKNNATGKDSDKDPGSKTDTKTLGPKCNPNPFLGNNSTSTSFNIKFSIETDSGIAGITWGSDDDLKGEYYLWAFDCTRDIPKLYTCRRQGQDVWDEEYTNLDFMYPEMGMFTSCAHIVEISVSGNKVSTYLDSYHVADTTINCAKSIGQIGTWVMKGDYHAYYDDLFVAEGEKGDGTYLYSEDFAGKASIFPAPLKCENGRLYAKAGYYVVPKTEK